MDTLSRTFEPVAEPETQRALEPLWLTGLKILGLGLLGAALCLAAAYLESLLPHVDTLPR
jgi:hypothetical protein